MNREELKTELQKLLDSKGNITSFYTRESYLRQHGLWDALQLYAHSGQRPACQVWEILLDANPECIVCGKLCKMESETSEKCFRKTCSWTCMGIEKRGRPITRDEQSAWLKRKQTMIDKYGVSTNSQRADIKEELHEKRINTLKEKYGEDWSKEVWKISQATYEKQHGLGHPWLENHYQSKGELELGDWVESLGFNIDRQNRKVLEGKEIDIYIPDLKIGIEFDGLYWHREDRFLKTKQELAASKGIRLLRIFQDEWENKQDILKSVLLAKLGKCEVLYARNLEYSHIQSKEANLFLEKNHMQGACKAPAHIALLLNEQIQAVVSIGQNRFTKGKELVRFATKSGIRVVGGMSKLLKEEKDILTYADRRFTPIADKCGYSKVGKFLGSTQPGYSWVIDGLRVNRMQLQKHKLPAFLGESFDASKSETQNLHDVGYFRVYDCGHWKFLLNPSS